MNQLDSIHADLLQRAERFPRSELPALTSIRALLAWWVVAFHFLPRAPFHFDAAGALLSKGPLAVDCFFVLSGFVLCHVHPVIIGASRRFAVADFLVSRLARIYPLHAVMLMAFALVVFGFRLMHGTANGAFSDYTLPALARQVFLLNGLLWFTDSGAWNVPSWSISSEWGAYLLAPLIFLGLSRSSHARLLILLAATACLTLLLVETHWIYRPGMGLPHVLLDFTVGAVIRTLLPLHLGWLRRIRGAGLWAGWLVSAVAAFSSHQGIMLLGMTWLMLMLALRTRRAIGWPGRLERITIYLGETSFAVYMSHAFVLMLWTSFAHSHFQHLPAAREAGLMLGLMVVIQAFASLLHHTVERPAQKLIRRSFRRWQSGRSAEPAYG